MPHVVLNGTVEIIDIFQKLLPITVRYEKTLLRTSDKYININESSILVESLVVEDGKKLVFLL